MKYIIGSDIHGSAYYCEQFVKLIEEEKPDKIILLGDILYHGPRNSLPEDYNPLRVAELLSPYKDIIIGVRGNCDAEIDEMVLGFNIMETYAVIENEVSMFVTHGHIYNNDNLPLSIKNKILLHGHTHVPVFDIHDDYIYVNPGSISIPKENSEHSCIVLEGKNFKFKNLQGTTYREETIK